MGIIATKFKKILQFDLNQATKQAIDRNKQKVIDLNKQQLNDGLKADGKDMPSYSARSLEIKRAEGVRVPRNQSFSLKHSGDLQNAMFVKAENTYMEISSADPMLNKKLTDQVFPRKRLENKDAFGLTPQSRTVLVEQILIPFYQLKFKS